MLEWRLFRCSYHESNGCACVRAWRREKAPDICNEGLVKHVKAQCKWESFVALGKYKHVVGPTST